MHSDTSITPRRGKKSATMSIESSTNHPSSNVVDFRQLQFNNASKSTESHPVSKIKSEQTMLTSQRSRKPIPTSSTPVQSARKVAESQRVSALIPKEDARVQSLNGNSYRDIRRPSPINFGTKQTVILKRDNTSSIQEVVSVSTIQDAYGAKSLISKHVSATRIASIMQWLQRDLNLTLDTALRLPIVKNGNSSSSPLPGHLTVPTYLFRISSGTSNLNAVFGDAGNLHRDVRLADQWTNGTLLSQVIASLPLENKSVVKQANEFTYISMPKTIIFHSLNILLFSRLRCQRSPST